MSEALKNKLVEHMEETRKLNEEETKYVKEIFGKEYDLYIFFCHHCKTNTFLNRKNKHHTDIRNRHWFAQRPIAQPKCSGCGELMNRVVINKFKDNAEVSDFLRQPRPQIFCSITAVNVMEEGSVSTVALAEDGEGICSHYSGSKSYAKIDIGILSNTHHDDYSKKYPEGFELVWVKPKEWDSIPEVKEAEKLNFLRTLTKMFKKFKNKRDDKKYE